jgi:uncharacterized phosphosugar-binding protein
MGNYHLQYLEEVIRLLQRIADEEGPALSQAADLVAEAIVQGQRIFAFGCTHSSLPIQDLVYRAGGLMLINPLFGPGIASLDLRNSTMSSEIERLSGYARILLDNSPIQPNDVLILVSVSGRNAVPIEMAQLAKERGIQVIGITSRTYAGSVTSRHPSGKKMHEFADVVLDNKVEKGDAVLQVDGLPVKFCPASGVTSIAILQSLVAATVEKLLARGYTPPIFVAGNVDGSAEHNARLIAENKDRVFYL